MNNPITKLKSGDFKVESLEEFDQKLKELRNQIHFPKLKGKKK